MSASVEGVNLAAHYSSNSVFAFQLNCHLLSLPLPTPSPANCASPRAQPLVTPKTAYSAKCSKACSHCAVFGAFSCFIDAEIKSTGLCLLCGPSTQKSCFIRA